VKRKHIVFISIIIAFWSIAPAAQAGGSLARRGPALDYTLMAFKEQGIWYFLCCAPEYGLRIPPHYLTFGPPPPHYCPPPCAPVPQGIRGLPRPLTRVIAPDRYPEYGTGIRLRRGEPEPGHDPSSGRNSMLPISTTEPKRRAGVENQPAPGKGRPSVSSGSLLRSGPPDR